MFADMLLGQLWLNLKLLTIMVLMYLLDKLDFMVLYHKSTIVKIDLKRIWSKEYSNYKKKSLNWSLIF